LSERTHYIRENKGGFEFFHAISLKGSLVQGLGMKVLMARLSPGFMGWRAMLISGP
jgi:hypothetical protein